MSGNGSFKPWCRSAWGRGNCHKNVRWLPLVVDNTHGYSRGTVLLDAELGQPLAHVDAGLEALTLGDTGEEPTGEGVTGTVGVGDLGVVDGVDGELLDLVLALN